MRVRGYSTRVHTPAPLPQGAPAAARELRTEVTRLRSELHRLMMIVEALWEMVREQHGYTDDELLRRVTLIDLRSGKLDGKPAKQQPGQCEHCGRTLDKKRPTCMYCGKPVRRSLFPGSP